MNERISELAEQAGFVFWHQKNKPLIDWSSVYDTELEKFAELIIKECAKLCNNFDVYYADNSPLKREVAIETAHDLADMIQEHFGVAE